MDEHPKHIYDSLLSYFKQEDLHQYPDMWETYDVLSKYLNVSEEQLLITRGVEGSFRYIYETILEKGDTIGVLTPTCAMYHVYSEVYGIEEIHIEGTTPDYNITVEQIKKVIPKIKVLFLDNPKSHLPSSFNDDELYEIIDFAEQHQVIVFLDEVYIGWEQKSYLPNLSKHKNLVVSQSFSKIAFPSLKSGWLVTSKELQKQISSTRNSYELDYFACKGIKWVIDHQDYVDDMKDKILKTKHKWFDKLSKSDKFEVFNSNGYTLRLFSSKDIIEKTYNNLYEKKIVVGIVKENNLVFSVTNNKEIEGIIFDEIFSNN
jgi:histidinol-phosphate/aromatic aminotransferase/cobyric acid decarboxylase-like protein